MVHDVLYHAVGPRDLRLSASNGYGTVKDSGYNRELRERERERVCVYAWVSFVWLCLFVCV